MSDKFKYFRNNEPIQALPVASGQVIEIGDHVMLSGGLVVPVAATTDNLALIGIAKEAHYATNPAGLISVALAVPGSIYTVELDAATDITCGDTLQLNGAQKLKKSATDPVAIAVETKLGALEILVTYRLPLSLVGDLT